LEFRYAGLHASAAADHQGLIAFLISKKLSTARKSFRAVLLLQQQTIAPGSGASE
jgi:hypothetical protein